MVILHARITLALLPVPEQWPDHMQISTTLFVFMLVVPWRFQQHRQGSGGGSTRCILTLHRVLDTSHCALT